MVSPIGHKALVFKIWCRQTAKERRDGVPVEWLSPTACARTKVRWGFRDWKHVTCKRCLGKRKKVRT